MITQTEKNLIERMADCGADEELTIMVVQNLTEQQKNRMIGFLEYMLETQEEIDESDILEAFVICHRNLKPKTEE